LSDTPQVLLGHHLKALKLPTFLREHDKLARQCAAEGVDHTQGSRMSAADDELEHVVVVPGGLLAPAA
jgi:hypothetical protein